jgi:hypothetical protein
MERNRYLWGIITAALFLAAAGHSFAYPAISLALDKSVCSPGDSMTARVNIDCSGGTDLLGEYSLEVRWDPSVLAFSLLTGGTSEGFSELLANETKTGSGILSITYLNAAGSGGMVNVARIVFIVRGAFGAKTDIAPVVKSLSAAGTFKDLSTSITVQSARFTVNSPPVFVTSSLPDVSQENPYTAVVTVNDPDAGDTHAFELLAAPEWMAINGASGELSGTPKSGDAGTGVPVTILVRDSFGLADTLWTSVNVTANFISILDPKVGASWSIGIENHIRWMYNGITDVKIELSVNDGVSWETIAERVPASSGSYLWKVPDKRSDTCLIRLSDASNATLFGESGVFSIIQPGMRIELVNPATQADQNAAITFSARVFSDAGVDSVKLYWDTTGRRVFGLPLLMKSTDGVNYSTAIGEGQFTAFGIEYYIEARDKTGMTVRTPAEGVLYSVCAAVTGMVSQVPVSGGTAQTAYRMISIPLVLSSTKITEQLSGLSPGGSGTEWRLFRFPPGVEKPVEYPDIEGYYPGKAFWLIVRSDFTLKAPPGTTVTTGDHFKIELEPGWNDIANPWTFPVSWGDIDNPSNATLDGLYSYEDKWSLPKARQAMEPWKGYTVRNMMTVPIVIFLNPKPTASSSKALSEFIALDWWMNISVRAGNAMDTENFLGVGKNASDCWDQYDHVEPPAMGEYVSVSFPHREWKDFPYDYTVDVRPPREELVWDFVVRTNMARETVGITLNGMSNLPKGCRLSVIDVDRGYALIRNIEAFGFTAGEGVTERHFRLRVSGSSESDRWSAKPEKFVASGWYPNPFNLSATVRYELSLPGNVVITFYNAVGQTIAEEKLGYKNEGIYEYVFNPPHLTSGLYFYRIETPYASALGKALCIK